MTERRDIGWRLENWGRVYRNTRRGSVSQTAVFCDRLEREARGEKPSGERRVIDELDAALVEAAVCTLPSMEHELLKLCYIDNADYAVICRKLRMPHWRTEVFISTLRAVQGKIERLTEPAEELR